MARRTSIKKSSKPVRKKDVLDQMNLTEVEMRGPLKKLKTLVTHNGGGRPSLYDEDFHPKLAYRFCKITGATSRDLAELLGVAENTILRWGHAYPEFLRAIRQGRLSFDNRNVRKALLDRCLGYDVENVIERIEESVDSNGVETKKVSTSKKTSHLPADVNAIKFWLTSRDPKRFSEKKEINVNVTNPPKDEDIKDITPIEASTVYTELMDSSKGSR
jgi:hypothetical protein